MATEEAGASSLVGYQHDAVSLRHGAVNGLTQPAQVVLQIIAFDFQPVHHYFDIVRLVAVQFHAGNDLLDLAIDPYMHEAFLTDSLEKLFVVALTTGNKRSQEQDFLAGIFVQQQINDLLVRKLNHRLAGEVRIGLSCAGI